jgi:cyclase
MRRAVVLTIMMMCGLGLAAAQRPGGAPEKAVRGIQNVRDNLYFISGGDTYDVGENRPTWTGGNVAVFVTDKGVVLVDSMLPGSGAGILAQIKKVTDKPVTMIINTHTHNDHTGGNTEFPATVEFVAHENTRGHLAKMKNFQGANAKFLPKRTFKDKLSIGSGKDQIDLYYFGRAHTDGDLWVVFPAVRAMHGGDVFQRRNMPAITTGDGGSPTEFAATVKRALNEMKYVDYAIGGHTPIVFSWLDFKDFVDFYSDFYTYVQTEKKAGKSVDQIVSGYRIPARYNGYYADPGRVKANVQGIYDNK